MSTASTSLWNVSTPIASYCSLSTANPNTDGTGTCVQLAGGYSNGARIDWVHFQALGATTAGMIRVYVGTINNPAALVEEIPVAAMTPAAGQKAWAADWYPTQPTQNQPSPLNLMPSNNPVTCLWVSTANAEAFRVSAFGAAY